MSFCLLLARLPTFSDVPQSRVWSQDPQLFLISYIMVPVSALLQIFTPAPNYTVRGLENLA